MLKKLILPVVCSQSGQWTANCSWVTGQTFKTWKCENTIIVSCVLVDSQGVRVRVLKTQDTQIWLLICVWFGFPTKEVQLPIKRILEITSTSSPLLKNLLKIPFSVCTGGFKVPNMCKLYTGPWTTLVVMSQHLPTATHVKLRFNVEISFFSKWKWKQPSSVKTLHSEA